MNISLNPVDENNLTETSVEQFKDFMKFIGDNNLWDEVEQQLKAEGIFNVIVSSVPIQSIRRLITDKLLKSDRLGRQAHAQAVVIARCGCGVSTPGPGHGPVSPSGGGGDAGPDAGHPRAKNVPDSQEGETMMSYMTEQERIGLRALAQELEDGRNTRASVSRELARTVTKDLAPLDLAARLAAVLDPSSARSASQLGPWDTGSITFSDGVAVGGYANLTLYQNGAFNFSGHMHVSGAISYDHAFVFAVKDSNVPVSIYVFARTGRLHGTFEAGSRDDDWGRSEINPALAAGWNALERGWSWHWEARVNADFGPFLDDIIRVVAAGTAIATVVKIILA